MKGPTRRKTPRVPEPARDWRFGRVTNVFAARPESKYRDGVQLQFIGAGDLEVQWTRGQAYGAVAVPREIMRELVLEAADRLGLVVTEK